MSGGRGATLEVLDGSEAGALYLTEFRITIRLTSESLYPRLRQVGSSTLQRAA